MFPTYSPVFKTRTATYSHNQSFTIFSHSWTSTLVEKLYFKIIYCFLIQWSNCHQVYWIYKVHMIWLLTIEDPHAGCCPGETEPALVWSELECVVGGDTREWSSGGWCRSWEVSHRSLLLLWSCSNRFYTLVHYQPHTMHFMPTFTTNIEHHTALMHLQICWLS